ncbi:MAG: tyrosine-type recombinase/integrase, partial [Phaeodactylibacter sp.]|nr:tyrosine-type recombinase/integrase [Phaeodactylibacter sp.]
HVRPMEQQLVVFSLKKRAHSKDKFRKIPITSRIIEAYANYRRRAKGMDWNDPEAYLFPPSGQSGQAHLSRKSVYRRIMKYTNNTVNPHMLRHYYATRMANNGEDIRVVQQLLGHSSQRVTERYLHVDEQQLRRAVQGMERERNLLRRVWQKLSRPQPVLVFPAKRGMTNFHVGRKEELERLHGLCEKEVNVLLLGPQGIGKSHLLDNYHRARIIRMDDFRSPKKTLAGLLLTLFDDDKDEIFRLLLEVEQREQLERIATKESIKRLCELAIDSTQPKEFTLVFDDLTDVTKYGVRILEMLKNHFHIIAAARRIKIEHATFLSNFERIELQPLSRPETLEMASRLAQPFMERIEDFEAFLNWVWENTQGIPLFVVELVERLGKEPIVSLEVLQEVRHTASKSEIDFSIPLIVAFSSLMALRYMGSELGHHSGAFRLLGGLALIVAIFSRRIFQALKRRFV